MTPSQVLAAQAHRPWPLPQRPWVMAMRWHDLLFAHWPLAPDVLRPRIPSPLSLDTYEDNAWLGVVPFRMSGVRPRGIPALPWFSAFPELNVRTYVTVGGKPGVWFFSLDAANRVAVEGARRLFHLAYFRAQMRCAERAGWIHYHCRRTDRRPASVLPLAPRFAGEAQFVGRYRPASEEFQSQPGTLDYFLTERYCLYAADGRGRVYRGEIHHAPWPLQRAEAEISINTMAAADGFMLPDSPPLLHFARRQDVVAWALQPLRR
ncbi:MAG: YqjF family protein [Candidatus Acidiferrales bacterium]